MMVGPRVVLADSHPVTRMGMRRALAQVGVGVVEEASDAEAAVDAVRRRQPDVCLVDVGLAGGGILATREIVAASPRTRVVVLFDVDAGDDVLAALRAGASGCLLKDIGPGALGRAIGATLAGEAPLPRAATARVIEELRGRWGSRRARTAAGTWVTLSSRESQVFDLMQRDLSTQQIAEQLGISPVTVRRHVSTTVRRLGVGDRDAALRLGGGTRRGARHDLPSHA